VALIRTPRIMVIKYSFLLAARSVNKSHTL
jgi:hypothetical protein